MNCKKVLLLVMFLSFMLIGSAIAKPKYTVRFENKSDRTVVYYLFQIDHELKGVSKAIPFVIGSLDPGKSWQVNREEGTYYIVWKKNFETKEKIHETEHFKLNHNMIFTIGPLPKE